MRPTDGVERVVQILDLVAASTADGLSVGEAARALGVHPSTASRLLRTLEGSGMVEREAASRRFRLGARLLGLAASAVQRLPVVSQARAELEELSAVTSETANLAILERLHVVYVDQVTPAQTVVMASWVGRRSPAHASSSGKVMVAFGDPATRDALLRRGRRLEALTPRTVTAPDALAAVLDQVRRRGYASSSGELEDGLVSIAAPVLVDGRAVAAISVSGPSFRLPARDLPRLASHVMDAATAAGHRMSGRSSGAPRRRTT
ncbi:MAG TPA: IclR family transcriptional regulator [Actinomycetota bacterium]|nr:IclR family transcriptional regulator [Actinomycetota bacterium]